MLSFLKLSIFSATVAALAVVVSSEAVSDFCAKIEKIKPCKMQGLLEVSFGYCGERVLQNDASAEPSVIYYGAESFVPEFVKNTPKYPLPFSCVYPHALCEPDKQYLLVMVDPDAPSAKKPAKRYWRHWVVAGISGASLKTGSIDGKTLSKYSGPTPPSGSGPHRYQLYLFSYTGNLKSGEVLNDKDRGSWNVAHFIQRNDLCANLVAGFEFISENA